MIALGGFARGLNQGLQAGRGIKDQREDAAMRAEDRDMRREELDLRKQALANPPMFPGGGYDGYSGGGGGRSVRPGGGGGGRSGAYETGDPAAEMEPHQMAFLNAVSGGESGGDYNVRYSPNGPVPFEGDEHPRVFEEGPHGPSSAAGRYQFTASTWDDTGGGAFTRQNQDTRAYRLAQDRYRAKTGRDLDADLRTRGLTPDILDPLTPTWQALGSNRDAHIATYNENMRRYAPPVDTPPAVATAAPSPPAQPRSVAPPPKPTWGAVRQLMTS